MSDLTSGKLAQAAALVAASGADVWLTFVRETAEGGDPVLPLILEGGLVWQSGLLVNRQGRKVAVVGNYDADPLKASGDWDEVVPYVQGIRQELISALERLAPPAGASSPGGAPTRAPRIAVNFSTDDSKADGLSHGMHLLLAELLRGTRFEGGLVSAEEIVSSLRSQKIPEELRRIREAIRLTEELLAEVPGFAVSGRSEREIFDYLQRRTEEAGCGFSWDRGGDPIVNCGPDSMIGHGVPSSTLTLAAGQILHIDFGILREGYASDLQRCWFVREGGSEGKGLPPEVGEAFSTVREAITAGAQALRPGVQGWQVDEVARDFIKAAGYPEYMHALGHQVGRMAHDGGALLGPRWERYGRTPTLPVKKEQVFTLELGVVVEGRGYLGLEEMVLVTESGCEWLSDRQMSLPVIG